MTQPTSLVWLPGLLCDGTLFEEVNRALPSWVEPSCPTLASLPSMEQLAQKGSRVLHRRHVHRSLWSGR